MDPGKGQVAFMERALLVELQLERWWLAANIWLNIEWRSA